MGYSVGSEVIMAMTVKSMLTWVVMPGSSQRALHFTGTYCCHLQACFCCFLAWLLFNPEDGGDMFL
jgi:hypothetical protein